MHIRLKISAAWMRDPFESTNTVIGYEEALFCDGSECRPRVFTDDGDLELLDPHWHMIVRGTEPEAGPRIYPVFAAPTVLE